MIDGDKKDKKPKAMFNNNIILVIFFYLLNKIKNLEEQNNVSTMRLHMSREQFINFVLIVKIIIIQYPNISLFTCYLLFLIHLSHAKVSQSG